MSLRPVAVSRSLVVLMAIVTAGCGSAAPSITPSPAPSDGAAAGLCETAPDAGQVDGWGLPETTPTLTPIMVTNDVTCGKARILFLYLDADNRVQSAPDRTATVSFYDIARDPNKVVATADGAFVWTIPDERGMYVVDVDLPEAGIWGAEFTTEAPGSPAETVRLTFPVSDTASSIAIGQPAPASKTPTAADAGGDVTKISTDATPDPAFYQTSVADALAAHDPFMLIFATPKFCQTAQCGPTLDSFKPIAAANPDVTFINVEPYELHDVDGQLQPVLDANNQLIATDVTDQWGLRSEPWIFAVDRDGIVRGSYAVTITPAELDAILPVIKAGA
jgi:hypothetical protein